MRYPMAASFCESTFSFLDNLHEPIFLISRDGRLQKTNSAGKKFLKIGQLEPARIAEFIAELIQRVSQVSVGRRGHIDLRKAKLRASYRHFSESDLILVEILRK